MPHAERKRIDPRRTASDFIGDLPTREYENMSPADMPSDRVNTDTPGIKRVAIRPATVVGLAVVVAAFTCGWATAALQYVTGEHDRLAPPPASEPAVTVTKTKTVTRLPPSCERALRDMGKYLDAAAAVSNAGDRQIDLLSEAYVAILQKDWKGLNAVSEKQRDLQTDTLPASSKVIPKLVEVRKEMNQCLADAN
jgi:hypothetical protein